HEDVASAAAAIAAVGHVGRVTQQVTEADDAELFKLLTGDRLDRDRHVLHGLTATLRRDHDLLDSGSGLRLRGEGYANVCTQRGKNCAGQLLVVFQVCLPSKL